MALEAQSRGNGYSLIILNAHSYDGILYDIPGVIKYLLENKVETRRFIIDEAWGATNYFHSELANFAATAARHLTQEYPGLNIVSTQSAHKSMSCLRQASMIHHCGDNVTGESLNLARFRLHTTSPSYPILASLDLGRAQMQLEGHELLIKSAALARRFSDELESLDHSERIYENSMLLPTTPFSYVKLDSNKVSVNVTQLGVNTADIRDRILNRFGIYINRITDSSLLLNFHIGITEKCVDRLILALRDIIAMSNIVPELTKSKNFIIPYPPGVPIVVPGEEITLHTQEQIKIILRTGAEVFYA